MDSNSNFYIYIYKCKKCKWGKQQYHFEQTLALSFSFFVNIVCWTLLEQKIVILFSQLLEVLSLYRSK